MAGDNLLDMIDAARRSMPDIPEDVWQRFEAVIRRDFGTERVYIAAHKKRQNLDQIQQLQQQAAAHGDAPESTAQLAKRLGVTERRARQYKQLLKA